MTQHEMDKWIKHCDTYFKQSDCMVLHPTVEMPTHTDILIYAPTEELPFWKLVTMGASDYKMPVKKAQLGDRNEYVVFVDPKEDLKDHALCQRYAAHLWEIALYPVQTKTYITYGHSVEWKPEEGEQIVGAFLEFPQIIPDTGVLRCKLGFMKTVILLQAYLLNREENERLLEIGPEQFSQYIYPDGDEDDHFLNCLSLNKSE